VVRVVAIVGAVLLGLLAWQTHRCKVAEKRATAAEVAMAQAAVQIAAEQAARAHEQEIARNASNQFQTTVTSLQAELAARPLKPVVIRVRDSAAVPEAHGSAGAAAGPDAAQPGRELETVEVDIAPGLTTYALDCQRNSAQLDALQRWVRAR